MAAKIVSSIVGLGFAFGAAFTSSAALADDAVQGNTHLSANIAITSDYIFRGVTQTDRGIAIQGGFDVSNGWFYAGTWASNVDFGAVAPDASIEIDLYGGIRPVIGSTTFDLGFIFYKYPDARSSDNLDYYEFYGGVAQDFHFVQASAKVYYTPDNTLGTKSAWYYSGNATVPITKQISLNGHVGHYKFSSNALAGPDYTDWTLGGQVTLGPVTVGANYGDTDRAGAKDHEGWLTVFHAF